MPQCCITYMWQGCQIIGLSRCGYATLVRSGEQESTMNFSEEAILEEVDNSS